MSQQDSGGLRVSLGFVLQPVHQKRHARAFVQVWIGERQDIDAPSIRGSVAEVKYDLPEPWLLITTRRRRIAETPDHLNTDVGIGILNDPTRAAKRPVQMAVNHVRHEHFHNGPMVGDLVGRHGRRAGDRQNQGSHPSERESRLQYLHNETEFGRWERPAPWSGADPQPIRRAAAPDPLNLLPPNAYSCC
jgi:hypothetical protein